MSGLVSIVMAVHNAAATLPETLRSVFAQSYTEFELIVIDDASDDGTAACLSAVTDNRLRVFRNENNLGLPCSLNRGLAEARGELIARMDADDLMTPQRLEKQVETLNAHPDIGVTGSFARNIAPDGRAIGINRKPLSHEEIKAQSFFTCPMIHPTVMLRRSVLPPDGALYDPAYRRAQDMECWSRLVHHVRFMNTDEILLLYRHQRKAVQKNMKGELNRYRAQIAERNLGFLIEHPAIRQIEAFQALLGYARSSNDEVAAIADRLRVINREKLIYDPQLFEHELSRRLHRYLSRHWGGRNRALWREFMTDDAAAHPMKTLPALAGVIALTKMRRARHAAAAMILIVTLAMGGTAIYDARRDAAKTVENEKIATAIANLCLKDFTGGDEIAHLRACVHANTMHRIDAEFKANWRDGTRMATMTRDYMEGRRKDKPHFECSTRSGLLSKVLKARGFSAKSVTVIRNDQKFSDHVILQVTQKDGTNRLVDASYNVDFRRIGNESAPATISDFVRADIVPCRDQRCGWNLPPADIGKIEKLATFPAAYIREKRKNDSVLIYDDSRFDPLKPASGPAYCEKKAKWCKKLVIAR